VEKKNVKTKPRISAEVSGKEETPARTAKAKEAPKDILGRPISLRSDSKASPKVWFFFKDWYIKGRWYGDRGFCGARTRLRATMVDSVELGQKPA
jgi:hypothetical protein